jgi:hypothetical protein
VLDADGGCQEVVRKIQALTASRSLPSPSASTSAYCQARAKLQVCDLESILAQTARTLHEQGRTERWKGRRVVVVDATGLSMPDTRIKQSDRKHADKSLAVAFLRPVSVPVFICTLAHC